MVPLDRDKTCKCKTSLWCDSLQPFRISYLPLDSNPIFDHKQYWTSRVVYGDNKFYMCKMPTQAPGRVVSPSLDRIG